MTDTNRWIIIGGAVAAGIAVLVIGFVIGRATASLDPATGAASSVSDEPDSTTLADQTSTTAEGLPEYGSSRARDELVTSLIETGFVRPDRILILGTADEICFHLERLQAQQRSPAFAIRVVWNESLAEFPPGDVPTFAAVFAAAPRLLCPDSLRYAEEVAYWLGF